MVINMLKCFYQEQLQNLPLNPRFYALINVYSILLNLCATKMAEVWHIETLQNQILKFCINNRYSSSCMTTFYVTVQKNSHGL